MSVPSPFDYLHNLPRGGVQSYQLYGSIPAFQWVRSLEGFASGLSVRYFGWNWVGQLERKTWAYKALCVQRLIIHVMRIPLSFQYLQSLNFDILRLCGRACARSLVGRVFSCEGGVS